MVRMVKVGDVEYLPLSPDEFAVFEHDDSLGGELESSWSIAVFGDAKTNLLSRFGDLQKSARSACLLSPRFRLG